MASNEVAGRPVDYAGDHAVTPILPSERRSTFDVALVAAGFCICMSGLFTGAAMAAGLSLWQAIFATFIGNTILAVYGGLVGAAGAQKGVSTTMLSRHAFGRDGAKVIGLLWAVTLVGWFSVQTGFFGQTINAMFPNGNPLASVQVAAGWGGLLMMVTAYFGYRGLSVLSKFAIPAITILALIGIFAAVGQSGGLGALAAIAPVAPITVGTGITLAVGSFAVGATIQADITRYAKDVKAAWIATVFGYMIANTFIIGAGAITALATGSGDLPSAMIALGLGIPALLILIAGQWTTNDNNLYSSSLGVSNVIKAKKKHIVLVLGVVATAFGVWGMADYFVPWLVILGVGIPPVAGILIADYWLLKRGNYTFGPGTRYAGWSWPAFAAWLIASVLGYHITWGIPSVNSIVIAFVLYLGLMHLCQNLRVEAGIGSIEESQTGF
ncbi:MAG: cytosine permease [bacterium]|nr:cytosine permease [bacterium]